MLIEDPRLRAIKPCLEYYCDPVTFPLVDNISLTTNITEIHRFDTNCIAFDLRVTDGLKEKPFNFIVEHERFNNPSGIGACKLYTINENPNKIALALNTIARTYCGNNFDPFFVNENGMVVYGLKFNVHFGLPVNFKQLVESYTDLFEMLIGQASLGYFNVISELPSVLRQYFE